VVLVVCSWEASNFPSKNISKAMKRNATAIWNGTGREGSGSLSTQSGALNKMAYTFKSRTEESDGTSATNPEELIAAAHAGCFAMFFSFQLAGAGFPAEELDAKATLTLRTEGGLAVESIDLVVKGRVPGVSAEQFQELAMKSKEGCPISKLFNCAITLEAGLV
jgi:lipoyl-dependent peroxiredoxin